MEVDWVMPNFVTDRRGRYYHNHTTRKKTNLPLMHKSHKKVNLATFKIGNKTYKCGTSKEEDIWLNKLGIINRQKPIFGYNGKVAVVDGIDYDKGTVYEYLGSAFHDVRCYPREKWDRPTWLGKTPRQLYNETINRFRFLVTRGWKVFFVWDKDFKKGFMGRYYKGGNDNLY